MNMAVSRNTNILNVLKEREREERKAQLDVQMKNMYKENCHHHFQRLRAKLIKTLNSYLSG